MVMTNHALEQSILRLVRGLPAKVEGKMQKAEKGHQAGQSTGRFAGPHGRVALLD
jgi:hypothetical protein